MDIYEVIREDHSRARRMLDEISRTEDTAAERRSELYPALKAELVMHQHVEEAVLYSKLSQEETTRPDALEAINEHHVVDTLLGELEVMAKGDDLWTAKFGVLKELVLHHMEEEEEEFFGHARKVLSDDEAVTMGAAMREKKAAGLEALRPVS